jgi:hypothetical protein
MWLDDAGDTRIEPQGLIEWHMESASNQDRTRKH